MPLTCHSDDGSIFALGCNEGLKQVVSVCDFDDSSYRTMNELRRNRKTIVAMAPGSK